MIEAILGVPISRPNEFILSALFRGHLKAASENENASSSIFRAYKQLGKGTPECLAAAILTTGGSHAPVTHARRILYAPTHQAIRVLLEMNKPVPGFGNSFYKDRTDPAFDEFVELVKELPAYQKILEVGNLIESRTGVRLHPNAAAFTACTAEILGLKPRMEFALFAIPRLCAWLQF